MNNTNEKEINSINMNINDCNIDITNNKRNKIDEVEQNNMLNTKKRKNHDAELQQEIIEINGNCCCSNVNVFDINKFIPFEKKTDDDKFKYEEEIFDDKYFEYYDNYYYEQSILNNESIKDDFDLNK
jgi:ribosomal protein L24